MCYFRFSRLRLSCSTEDMETKIMISVVEPEPDFLAGAGAGEKAPAPVLAPGCCCLAYVKLHSELRLCHFV